MSYTYSPDTGEFINTANPAAWMEQTTIAPPEFDPSTQGCFWRGTAWEVVTATPTPAPVPTSVTMRQARLALLQAGLLAPINAAVAAMPGAEGDAARIEWEFSGAVERHRPLVASLGAALGMTDADLDDLFRLAATL